MYAACEYWANALESGKDIAAFSRSKNRLGLSHKKQRKKLTDHTIESFAMARHWESYWMQVRAIE